MSNSTLTRSDLYNAVYDKLTIDRPQAIKLVETVFNELAKGIIQEGIVKISSFGVFHVRQKNQRIGRNPKTGEEAMVTARKSLSFRSASILKASVNGGDK